MFVPRSVSRQSLSSKQRVATKRKQQPPNPNPGTSRASTSSLDTEVATDTVEAPLHVPSPLVPSTHEEALIPTASFIQGETLHALGHGSVPLVQPPSDDEEPIVSFSKNQRWPEPGEPVCVVCGRYGEYIVDQTDRDICSLECKARHLHQLGLPLTVHKEAANDKVEELEVEKVETEGAEGLSSEGGGKKELNSSMVGWTYREHATIAVMTDGQVREIRSKHSVKVEGIDPPRPITEFSHLSLPATVVSNLSEAGYHSPTSVQMQAIPAALLGRDMLVCATTGSGKTLSFLLPLLLNIMHSTTPQQRANNPRALVLAPTRELAIQIEQQAKDIMKGVPMMRTALVVGGVPLPQQLHRLRTGVQVVIATPGRLNDIILHHTSDIELMDIEVFVVDEVDCVLQMGFENQFCEIEEILPKRRQNLMYSATIPPKIKRMASKMMENHLSICIGEPSIPCEAIKHTVIWVEENSKRKKLLALLNDQRHFRPPAVVFVSSKMGALLLADAINKTHTHLSAVGIHGDMAQERRSDIVRGCSEGRYSVVVATNVLGRGLDLVTVKQVIVFDMPQLITEFIHQIGRAGRLHSPGTAYTFINNSNKVVFLDLVSLLQRQGVGLPAQLINSPFLKAQQEKRKKRASEDASTQHGVKKQKLGHLEQQQKSYHDKSSLLQLIKGSSKKTK